MDDLTISASGLIENGKVMYVEDFRVEGSLKNKEQARMYPWNEFVLTSAGTLENYGKIYLNGNFALDGTVTEHPGSHIYHTYKAKTLGELKKLLKQAKAGDTITVDPGGSAFVISEDISVPEGVRLNISGALVINAGVTFTTTNLDVRGVTVNGTWENRGNTYCREEVYVADTGIVRHSNGYDFYCWGGLRIAEGGLVENNGYFQIDEKYENAGALTNNAGATARLVLAARNVAELKASLACENPGEKEITFWVSDAVTLTEDTVIPENTRLFVYDSSGNGAATLRVGEGATLITDGHFDFTCDVPLTVAGKWVNHGWGVKLNEGLTITYTGRVDSTGGSIDLTGEFVNSGVLVGGSRITKTLIIRSMDELNSAMQGVAPSGTVEIRGNSDFTISEDIAIPKGITVEVYEGIQKLCLDAGAKLTIDTGATLQSYAPIEVGGTVYNYGSIGARRGMTVNGTIHNYDYILVEGGELVGSDNVITHEAGMSAIRQNYFVDSEQALDEVLAEVDLGKWNWNTITVDEGFTLNGDVTIPRGVYLKIQSGTLKVSTGTKLVTYDNLDAAGNMVVNGHWTNNYGTAISSVAGELVVNGTVENGGHLELHQYTEAFQQKRIQNADRGRIDYNLTVYSLAELRNLIARGIYWPMSVYWPANDTVILDDDLSIPDNMSLYINGQRTALIIPKGVVLCTGTDKFDASYGNVIVQGVLHTDGNCGFNTIEVSGLLENAGGLSFDNMLITDSGKVTNAGVMVGKVDNQGELCNIDRTDAGKAFELELRRNCDWNDVFRNIRHGDSVRFTSFGDNSYIVVSEDTTLPEGVSLHCGNFKITEGVTLTTNGSMEDVSTINVDGVWVNNGIANAYNIAGTGTICNAGGIVAYEIGDEVKITGRPIQKEEDDSVIYASQLNLQETLDAAKRGQIVRCVRTQIYSSGQCGIIFNEDITVPEGVTLQFAGAFKVYFAANHTLIVNGTLVAAQPVYIAGSLVINGEVSIPAADEVDVEYMQYLGVAMGGINIVDGGACEINGSIRVGKTDYNGQSITDPFSVLEGVDTTTLTQRTVDGCWYLTKKTAEGKADIFCELPTVGCSLRLVGADGSMKELAPAGKGATITNIAPGQYTLEVSKPGYVTHSVSVDTAAIADTFAVELVMVGDINGCASEWGDVDVTDMACLYTLLSTGSYDGQIKDEEYMKRVADVNGDGMINILDYQRLYMALNGAKA
ncbi:MAG: dockerin type I domain-containing protein [Oscillibacter sp.]|nr:dockerin type I domain-containing protein [Oscillibacter sp.]